MTVAYRPPTIRQRKNEKPAEKRWEPVVWQPKYEEIVTLHCKGLSNIFIAEKLGMDKVSIGLILNTTEAKIEKARFIEHLRKISFESAEEGILACQTKAMENVTEILNNDELKANSPFGMFDRSMSFLKAIGKMQGDKAPEANNTVNNTTVVINNSLNQLTSGLKAAEEARRLNSGISGESIN